MSLTIRRAALVVLDLRAVLAHQRFDLHLVEAPAGQHHGRPRHLRPVARPLADDGDDAVDVGLDVDAGLVLELVLAVLVHREARAKPLAEVGGHDFVDVGVGDERRRWPGRN